MTTKSLKYMIPWPLFLSATACQTHVSRVPGPDGSNSYLVSCSDTYWCYQRANELCGRYKIINTTYETDRSFDGTYVGTTTKMLIKCESTPALPGFDQHLPR